MRPFDPAALAAIDALVQDAKPGGGLFVSPNDLLRIERHGGDRFRRNGRGEPTYRGVRIWMAAETRLATPAEVSGPGF